MSKYAAEQIKEVIKRNSDSEFPLSLIIKGEKCSTKNLNISNSQAQKIKDILSETILSVDGRVYFANETSIVVGTIVKIKKEEPSVFVKWDDTLYSNSNITENWYYKKDLENVF